MVGAGQGPRAGLGAGDGAGGTAAAGPGRDPDPGPLRQAGRGADLQAGLRVSSAGLLAGPGRWPYWHCPSRCGTSRCWSEPTPPPRPTPSPTSWPAATLRFRSGSTATSASSERSSGCPSRHGSPPWTPTADPARVPGSLSSVRPAVGPAAALLTDAPDRSRPARLPAGCGPFHGSRAAAAWRLGQVREFGAYQAGFRANSLRGVGSLYPNLSRTCAACRYPSSSMRSKPSASATRSIRLNAKQT